jgi:hypothetical protein
MPAGKPGDHPLTDLLSYGQSGFGPEVDDLVRKMAKHRRFDQVRERVSVIMWDYWPAWESGALEGGAEKAYKLLLEIYLRMDK